MVLELEPRMYRFPLHIPEMVTMSRALDAEQCDASSVHDESRFVSERETVQQGMERVRPSRVFGV